MDWFELFSWSGWSIGSIGLNVYCIVGWGGVHCIGSIGLKSTVWLVGLEGLE